MKRSSLVKLGLCAVALVGVQGCALAIAGGVTGGVAAAQEGGLSRAVSDARIQTNINHLWFESNIDIFRKLDLTVTQGRVLITGVVQDPEHRVEAVRLAWQPAGVKEVINEITVADSKGIVGYARDTWIATRLRAGLIADKNVQSINYNIDTVQGVVYLMGVAQSQLELNRVIERARTIGDVKQVVSYVKFAGVDNPLNDGGYEPATPPADVNAPRNGSVSQGEVEAIDWGDGDRDVDKPVALNASTQPSADGGVQRIESEQLLWGVNQ